MNIMVCQVDDIGKLAVELRSSLRAPPLERVLSQVVKSLLAQKRCTPWARQHIVGYLCGSAASNMPADAQAALDKALGAPSQVHKEGPYVMRYTKRNFSIQGHALSASGPLNEYARAHAREDPSSALDDSSAPQGACNIT